MATQHFSRELFQFLVELKFNNDRAWFTANKERYEQHVKEPVLAFITDIQKPLKKVLPFVVADPRPVGGSMFRIYRDTRFAKDKTPYKTHVGIHFRHHVSTEDVHGPGIYIHLEPGKCFVGGGIWHPEAESLKRIRTAIATKPSMWKQVTSKLEISGDSLTRVPKGFAKDHPLVEDLKRIDFITERPVSDRDVTSRRFMDLVLSSCADTKPLMTFLSKAVL